ncbi:MAG: endonuclease/exonuclease/phosphatase family protein [Pirellula sp.]
MNTKASNQPNNSDEASLTAAFSISIFERGLLLITATWAVFSWCVMIARIMSDMHPIWDLASHLSWHTWVALSVALLFSVLGLRFRIGESRLRWWHRFIMVLPPWLYFTWVTLPWTTLPLEPNHADVPGLKIFAWNIWVMNQSPDEVLKSIRESDADIVAIVELTHHNAELLKVLETEYPYPYWLPDYTGRGMAMLSRIPGTRFRSFDLADQGMPVIEADVPETDEHSSYRVIAVHTRSPDLHQKTLDRNLQLNALADWANQSNKPGIIIGDLNITPWSPPFARLMNRANLEDSRTYRGHFASWPTDLKDFAIPIDHALVTKGTKVLYRGVGDSAPDSDHRPITVIVK